MAILKPTMNINLQHHNLFGNQISSKLKDFYILAAILDSKWPLQQTNDEYQFATSQSIWKPNFVPIGGFLYFGGHFEKMANITNQQWISIRNIRIYLEAKFRPNQSNFVFWRPFWIKKNGFKMATIANQRQKSIRNIIIYLENKFLPNRTIFIFWRPIWIQNGRYSKPMMVINSQHHNLLGNQISSKSEEFCILAAILDSKWPPQQTNDRHQFATS